MLKPNYEAQAACVSTNTKNLVILILAIRSIDAVEFSKQSRPGEWRVPTVATRKSFAAAQRNRKAKSQTELGFERYF
jgi:hypothetical protein